MIEARITIFGDSIAWGAGDSIAGGWVNRLKLFFDKRLDDDISVYNLGLAGDTSKDLLKRFNVECQARNRHPQIIVFAIGINDSRFFNDGKAETTKDQFISNINNLVSMAQVFSKDIVFLGLTMVNEDKVNPVPWRPDLYYSNNKIIEYDDIIATICNEKSIPFISMLNVADPKNFEDGLHPNPDGHEKMFLRIKDFFVSYLNINKN